MVRAFIHLGVYGTQSRRWENSWTERPLLKRNQIIGFSLAGAFPTPKAIATGRRILLALIFRLGISASIAWETGIGGWDKDKRNFSPMRFPFSTGVPVTASRSFSEYPILIETVRSSAGTSPACWKRP